MREAFQGALAVRPLGPEARALADRFFFEALVRLHREGEGAPYTGLNPSGFPADPAVAASDRALESGSVEVLVSMPSACTATPRTGLSHGEHPTARQGPRH